MKTTIKIIVINLCLFMCCSFTTSHKNHSWTATFYGNNYKTVRHTANGEIFNKNAMTCAAPQCFKFGTKLKVTNVSNGKSVIVKVTDRGKNNLNNNTIDLTHGAFGKIAEHKHGRIRIAINVLK